MGKKMEHAVVAINKKGEVVYVSHHKTAESAYEEYVENIRISKKFIKKGEEVTIARLNGGSVMTFEKIAG